jgi:ABC-type nitrate/sulfonate/bicarbonate transport system substrate-binding protein
MLRSTFISAAVLSTLRIGAFGHLPARAASPTTVSIALNWLRNVEFAGIWAAQEQGWWAQAGLEVTTRPFDGTNDPCILVAAGKLQFGIHDGASVILARAAGCPIKAVWASGQRSPFAFITLPTSGITRPNDFKGKRIGVAADARYVLDVMLHAVGLTEADVIPVVVGLDPAVLLAGKVDAYLGYLTDEPIEIAQRYHVHVNVIPASAYGYDFYSDVLFTTDSIISAQPALVKTVVEVMDRGWKYALAHPSEIARYVVPRLDSQDAVSQQVAELTALVKLASAPGAPVGSMTASRWHAGIRLLARYKKIHAVMPVDSVFTTRFLSVS